METNDVNTPPFEGSGLLLNGSTKVQASPSSASKKDLLRQSKTEEERDKDIVELPGSMLGLPQVIFPGSLSHHPSPVTTTTVMMGSPLWNAGTPGRRRRGRQPQVTLTVDPSNVKSAPSESLYTTSRRSEDRWESRRSPPEKENPLFLASTQQGHSKGSAEEKGHQVFLSPPPLVSSASSSFSSPPSLHPGDSTGGQAVSKTAKSFPSRGEHASLGTTIMGGGTTTTMEGGEKSFLLVSHSPPPDLTHSSGSLLFTSFPASSAGPRHGTSESRREGSGGGDGRLGETSSSPLGTRAPLTPSFVISSSLPPTSGEEGRGGTVPSSGGDRHAVTPSPRFWASNMRFPFASSVSPPIPSPSPRAEGGGAGIKTMASTAATTGLGVPSRAFSPASQSSLLHRTPSSAALRGLAGGGGCPLLGSSGDTVHASTGTPFLPFSSPPVRALPTAVYGSEHVILPMADVLQAAMAKAKRQGPIQERNIHDSVEWILTSASTVEGGGGLMAKAGTAKGPPGSSQRQREAHSNYLEKKLQSIAEARRSQKEMYSFQLVLKEMEEVAFQRRRAYRWAQYDTETLSVSGTGGSSGCVGGANTGARRVRADARRGPSSMTRLASPGRRIGVGGEAEDEDADGSTKSKTAGSRLREGDSMAKEVEEEAEWKQLEDDNDDVDEDDDDDQVNELEDVAIPPREERSRLLSPQTSQRMVRYLCEREARRWLQTQKYLMEHPTCLYAVDGLVKKSTQHLQQVSCARVTAADQPSSSPSSSVGVGSTHATALRLLPPGHASTEAKGSTSRGPRRERANTKTEQEVHVKEDISWVSLPPGRRGENSSRTALVPSSSLSNEGTGRTRPPTSLSPFSGRSGDEDGVGSPCSEQSHRGRAKQGGRKGNKKDAKGEGLTTEGGRVLGGGGDIVTLLPTSIKKTHKPDQRSTTTSVAASSKRPPPFPHFTPGRNSRTLEGSGTQSSARLASGSAHNLSCLLHGGASSPNLSRHRKSTTSFAHSMPPPSLQDSRMQSTSIRASPLANEEEEEEKVEELEREKQLHRLLLRSNARCIYGLTLQRRPLKAKKKSASRKPKEPLQGREVGRRSPWQDGIAPRPRSTSPAADEEDGGGGILSWSSRTGVRSPQQIIQKAEVLSLHPAEVGEAEDREEGEAEEGDTQAKKSGWSASKATTTLETTHTPSESRDGTGGKKSKAVRFTVVGSTAMTASSSTRKEGEVEGVMASEERREKPRSFSPSLQGNETKKEVPPERTKRVGTTQGRRQQGFKQPRRRVTALPPVEGVGRRYEALLRHSTLTLRRKYVQLEQEYGEDAVRTSHCLEQLYPLREALLLHDLFEPYKVTHPLQWEEKYLWKKKQEKEACGRMESEEGRMNATTTHMKDTSLHSPLLLLPPGEQETAEEEGSSLLGSGEKPLGGVVPAAVHRRRGSSTGSPLTWLRERNETASPHVPKETREEPFSEELPMAPGFPPRRASMARTSFLQHTSSGATVGGVAEEMRRLSLQSKSCLPNVLSLSTHTVALSGKPKNGEGGRGEEEQERKRGMGSSGSTAGQASGGRLDGRRQHPTSFSSHSLCAVTSPMGLPTSSRMKGGPSWQVSPLPHAANTITKEGEMGGTVAGQPQTRKKVPPPSGGASSVPFMDPHLMIAKHREIIFQTAKKIDEEERKKACLEFVDCLEILSKERISPSTWLAVEAALNATRDILLAIPHQNQQNFEGFIKMVNDHFTIEQLVEWPVQEMLRRLCGIFFVSAPQYRDWMAGMYQKVNHTHDYEGKFRLIDLTIKNKDIPTEAHVRITLHRARRLPRVDVLLLNGQLLPSKTGAAAPMGTVEGGVGGKVEESVREGDLKSSSMMEGDSTTTRTKKEGGIVDISKGGAAGEAEKKDMGSPLGEGRMSVSSSPLSSITMMNEWKKEMQQRVVLPFSGEGNNANQKREDTPGAASSLVLISLDGSAVQDQKKRETREGGETTRQEKNSIPLDKTMPGHVGDCTMVGKRSEGEEDEDSLPPAVPQGLTGLVLETEGPIDLTGGEDQWSTETEKVLPIPEYAVRMKVERQVITSSAVPAGNTQAGSGDGYDAGLGGELPDSGTALLMMNSKSSGGSNSVAARQKVYFYDQTFKIHLYNVASIIDVELLSDGVALSSGHLSVERYLHWRKSTIWLPLRGTFSHRLTEIQMTIEML